MLRQSRTQFTICSKPSTLVALTTLIIFSVLSLSSIIPFGLRANASEDSHNKISNTNETPRCPTCSPTMPRMIYAPTIDLPEAAGSGIVLNCRSVHEMEATPTFYTSDGEAIVGDTIRLQPAEIRFVTIESLIPEEHRGRHIWGGMSLSYMGGLMEVWAQITLNGAGNRGSADVTFSVLNNLGSDTQEAVWWQPTPGKTIIALGNSSNNQIHTTVQFSDGDIREVDIAPFATRYIRRNNSNNSASRQSAKLTTNGAAGSLKAVGYVTSNNGNSNRFASSIRFYDTLGVVQPKLFANNFRVKNAESHLLLKNTTTSSITAQAKFLPTDGNGEPITLPPVTLNAGEISEVNLQPLQAASATRNDLDSVSVQVDNSGAAGNLIGALSSKNQTTGVVYDVPLRDSGRLRNSTGAYPWRLDGDYTSIVTLTNTSNEPTQFRATVFYNGGRYMISPRTLAVGETAKFNLKKLRDEGIPDVFGNTIPATAMSGQFTWSILRPTDSSRLIGRSEVVSRSNRVSSSYSCGQSCPDSGPSFRVDTTPIILFASGSKNSNVQEVWSSPNGWESGYPGTIPGLYTVDPTIAVSAMMQNGLMQTDGYAAGYAGWFSEPYTYSRYFDGGFDCFLDSYQQQDSGPIEVQNCDFPNNFRQVGPGTDTGNGVLHFEYAWGSSSGNLSDLSACTVGELVTYPGTGNYTPPSPPFNQSFLNPTIIDNPATDGGLLDNHRTSRGFVTPYTAASFTATQYYRYKCPCKNNGDYVNLAGPISIVRSVSRIGQTQNYKYTITKSGSSATINPLP